ncbi:MAG TPA: DinB family protein [Tepidiformaceae bacterium]|nr:DinB family protein [Tepidiformaceae bacterium]
MTGPPEMRAFYEGWVLRQRQLLDAVRPLTPEQMQLRPAPGEWAIWQLAANMAGGRLYWLCFILGEDNAGAEDLFTEGGWEDNPEHPRTAAEVVDAFERTWSVVERCLEKWSLADFNREVRATNWWGQQITVSPGWVLWRLMSHEVHHSSEIALILRIHTLPSDLNL